MRPSHPPDSRHSLRNVYCPASNSLRSVNAAGDKCSVAVFKLDIAQLNDDAPTDHAPSVLVQLHVIKLVHPDHLRSKIARCSSYARLNRGRENNWDRGPHRRVCRSIIGGANDVDGKCPTHNRWLEEISN